MFHYVPRGAGTGPKGPLFTDQTREHHTTPTQPSSPGMSAIYSESQMHNTQNADAAGHHLKARHGRTRSRSDSAASASAVKKVQRVMGILAVTKTMMNLSKYTREYKDAIDYRGVDPSRQERQSSIRHFASVLCGEKVPYDIVLNLTRDVFMRLDKHYGGYVTTTQELISAFIDSAEGTQFIEKSVQNPEAVHTDLFLVFLKEFDKDVSVRKFRPAQGEGLGSVSIDVGPTLDDSILDVDPGNVDEKRYLVGRKASRIVDTIKRSRLGKIWTLQEDATEAAA